MDAEAAATLLRYALVGLGFLVVMVWALPGPCACQKCGFHANERRMAALRRAEARHDAQHRGFRAPGMPAPTADRWPCSDPTCERNPK